MNSRVLSPCKFYFIRSVGSGGLNDLWCVANSLAQRIVQGDVPSALLNRRVCYIQTSVLTRVENSRGDSAC